MTRRQILMSAGLAAAARLEARKLDRIGAQLYTLRGVLPPKPLETLQALERMGYREVEVVGQGIEKIWDSLKQTSLKPVSVHLDTPLFTRDQARLGPALEDARKRGFAFVVCPYIAAQDRGGPEVIAKLAENLNRAGEQSRAMGLKLCYHNHAFEFAPADGGTLLDVLMSKSDPKLVGLELDIMWVKVGGHDPAALIRRYGSRIELLHLKNVSAGIGPQFNESVPRTAFQDVGSGVIDIAGVLRAAAQAGVKHYFVEQDQTPGDPLDSLRASYNYLAKLDF